MLIINIVSLFILKIHGIIDKSLATYYISIALADNLSSLRELFLNYFDLGDVGVMQLANGFKKCKNLCKLDLAYNNITDRSAETLVDVVKHLHRCNLQSLNIGNNDLSKANEKKIYSKLYWSSWLKPY